MRLAPAPIRALARIAPHPRQPRRVVLAVGVALSAWLVFFPAKQLTAQKLRIAALESRLAAVSVDNERLEAQARRLEDPAELELLARDRLGWVKPGERAYLVVPEPAPAPAPPAPQGPRWWERLADRALALVRGRG